MANRKRFRFIPELIGMAERENQPEDHTEGAGEPESINNTIQSNIDNFAIDNSIVCGYLVEEIYTTLDTISHRMLMGVPINRELSKLVVCLDILRTHYNLHLADRYD